MSVHYYADLLFRSARVAAFKEAIERVVEPGMRVLDLGTGLGTYALLAARAGAGRVTAIEAHRVIHLARALAAGNGLADRIDFIHARAPEGLPDGVFDLVIFEDYPTTFLDDGTWQLLQAIQARHLAPGGRLLPGGVRFNLAPVTGFPGGAPPVLSADDPGSFLGLDWSGLRPHLANTGRQVHLRSGALAAACQPGPRRPILALPGDDALGAEGEWVSTGRPVVGLAFWFDLDLGEGHWVSNGPGESPEAWGQWFLPVDPPLEAEPGARVTGRAWREVRPDGAPGWMGWSCRTEGTSRRGHEFAGLPLSPEDLGRPPGR